MYEFEYSFVLYYDYIVILYDYFRLLFNTQDSPLYFKITLLSIANENYSQKYLFFIFISDKSLKNLRENINNKVYLKYRDRKPNE